MTPGEKSSSAVQVLPQRFSLTFLAPGGEDRREQEQARLIRELRLFAPSLPQLCELGVHEPWE